jgi:hypothetical protein
MRHKMKCHKCGGECQENLMSWVCKECFQAYNKNPMGPEWMKAPDIFVDLLKKEDKK